MKAIGIKVLKAKLSEFIRLVKAGETVLVTEHDEVVAELRPAHRQNHPQDFLSALSQLSDKGEVSLPSDNISDWKGFSSNLKGLANSKELLGSLRRDRS